MPPEQDQRPPRWFQHILVKVFAGIVGTLTFGATVLIPSYEFYTAHRDAHFRQIMHEVIRDEFEIYDQRHDYEHRVTVIETEMENVRGWADKQGYTLPRVKATVSNRGHHHAETRRPALPHN